MFVGINKKYVINDLRIIFLFKKIEETEDVKFLRPTSLKYTKRKVLKKDRVPNNKRDFTEDSYTFTPIFASGRVLASTMLGSILFQSFHNPFITQIIRYLCGMHTVEEIEMEREFELGIRSISYIAVPIHFVGLSFGEYYEELNIKYGILAIGLYRDELSNDLQNRLPFVYTNPLSSLLLRKTDLVYVIADDSQI